MNVYRIWISLEEENEDGNLVDKHEDTSVGPFATLDAASEWLAREPGRLLDDTMSILHTLAEHASETYPHFESERGQAEIATARELLAKIDDPLTRLSWPETDKVANQKGVRQ